MWHDGFTAYLTAYEVRLHRRQKSYGAYVWPDNAPGLIGPQRQMQIAMAAIERRKAA